jgi:hypothetical protein
MAESRSTALSIAAIPEKDFPVEWSAAIFRARHEQASRSRAVLLLGGQHRARSEIKVRATRSRAVDEPKN